MTMNLPIVITVSVICVMLALFCLFRHLRTKIHEQMNKWSDEAEKSTDLTVRAGLAREYKNSWRSHKHFGLTNCEIRKRTRSAYELVRYAPGDLLQLAKNAEYDKLCADKKARDIAKYEGEWHKQLKKSDSEYRVGLRKFLRKEYAVEFLNSLPNDSYEERRAELENLFNAWIQDLTDQAHRSKDKFIELHSYLSDTYGELYDYVHIIEGYRLSGNRTVNNFFPDDWNVLVARYYANPCVGDFHNLKSLASGDLRFMALEALDNHDIVLAKIVLAYCNHIYSNGKRHVFQSDVSDDMRDRLAELIKKDAAVKLQKN